ncbi:hypothetical protein Pcinc_027652 [Petrolisthes cinctipes]|uniref:Cyanocobalamin reductase (cyanide-eliminating) n=1 Tax=Petrolisthes cinctipes TaxID=88211 RepID=A0AAE1F3L0_PETCI|nr:hypothetical protein Pcinc_027652 [Petrolisthes cinctipes]
MSTSAMKEVSIEELKEVEKHLDTVLTPAGFEYHPFKIGWYNEQVAPTFRLPYHDDAVAFIIISTPSMFEKTFIPFVSKMDCERVKQDPLDQCMAWQFATIKQALPSHTIEIIHDFDTTPNKRPRVLVQTAGHVSGAVRYYQYCDVTPGYWQPHKKIFGVCLHPQYGGWFALRGVAIFTALTCPHLPKRQPREILMDDAAVVELLERYNNNWQDWSFRDVIPVQEKYSHEQKNYFSTKPADRQTFIDKYRSPRDQGREESLKAFENSLANLHLDYLDLYLIHWPAASRFKPEDPRNKEVRGESWSGLEEIYKSGRVRAVGVSNYTVDHLKDLLSFTALKPHVNQVEYHPYYLQKELKSYCECQGIHLQAYSSLGTSVQPSPLLLDPTVTSLATHLSCSPAQLLLRWATQQGIGVLPKSTTEDHIRENIKLDFDLNEEDLKTLFNLGISHKYAWDPSTVV